MICVDKNGGYSLIFNFFKLQEEKSRKRRSVPEGETTVEAEEKDVEVSIAHSLNALKISRK